MNAAKNVIKIDEPTPAEEAEEPQETDEIEGKVLSCLRNGRRELSPEELVDAVLAASPHLTDVEVKRAVWYLISKGRVQLSPEQQLSSGRAA